MKTAKPEHNLPARTLPSGWREVKLGDVMRIFTGRKNVDQTNPKGKYRFFSCSQASFLSDEYIADNDALIITGNGSYTGTVRFYSGKFDLYQRTYACILNRESSNLFETIFIYYYVKKFFEKRYMGGTRGSSIPYIVRGDIENFIIPKPPLPEQKAIAEVLSRLDDKIDLLHRQNKTLENMAQALFRKWFIDEADKSWEKKPLRYFGDVICGKTPSKKISEYFGGIIPFIKIPDMHQNTFILDTTDTLSEEGKRSQENKTLPPKSICVSCIATVGLVSMNAFESQTNQQINSIIPKKEEYRYFIYLFLRQSNNLLHSLASGGTMTMNLNTGNFVKIMVPTADKNLICEFHDIVKSMFEKVLSNQSQIRTLENLRDMLLSKLMSGEVRINI